MIPQHQERTVICEICQKSYKAKHILAWHIRTAHVDEKRYPCSQCDHQATSKPHLKRHIESVHKKIKHPCALCEHKASSKANLWTHIKSLHEKIKYNCNQCQHKASSKAGLKCHYLLNL